MRKVIFEGFGTQIINQDDQFFIRFDEGHFNIKWVEYKITNDEAKRAMLSDKDNYQVCLDSQKRNK